MFTLPGESIKSGRRIKRHRNLIAAVALTIVIACVVAYAHFASVSGEDATPGGYENISLEEARDLIEFESPEDLKAMNSIPLVEPSGQGVAGNED